MRKVLLLVTVYNLLFASYYYYILFCKEETPVIVQVTITIKKPPVKTQRLIKVAVIDTGLDLPLFDKSWVCKTGHKDFTGGDLDDHHGHGTHVSGTIDQYAKNVFLNADDEKQKDLDNIETSYCQIILKYYDPTRPNSNNLENTISALHWAIEQNVDIINYSGGGLEFSDREKEAIEEALDKGIKVVVAAGNERSDIEQQPYYPAAYDSRIIAVGSLSETTKCESNLAVHYSGHSGCRLPSSNYGKSIVNWELGSNIYSRLPGLKYGNMTGTSQAAAVRSGKIVRQLLQSD